MRPNELQQIPLEQQRVQCREKKYITLLGRSLLSIDEGIVTYLLNFSFLIPFSFTENVVEKVCGCESEEELR